MLKSREKLLGKKLKKIIQKARTIEEKRKSYVKGKKIDYRYFDEWRDVRTLLSDKYFEEMLLEKKMTKDEFAYCVQDLDNIEKVEGDEWFGLFEEIIEGFDYEKLDFDAGVNLVTLPFSWYLGKKIKEVIESLENITVRDEVVNDFVMAHATEMFDIVGKIVALKLAVFKQQQTFESENSEKRFIEFLKVTFGSKQKFYEFYQEYPVAARVATVRTNYLIENYKSMLSNLDKDYKDIQEFLGLDLLELTRIKLSTGDSHGQGKAVSVLEFFEKKIVYKPKDLRINIAFEKFVDWYVSSSNMLSIKIPRGIYKDGYAYNEFVEAKYCLNEKEVENFYIRYGYLIAICYLLGINDLHLENVIAHGEYPVIIDMETLFQMPADVKDDSLYYDLMRYLVLESVSNSFLLPRQISVGVDEDVDLSALNGREVKLKQKILLAKEINTDQFHYENVEGRFLGGDNIPKYNEVDEVDVSKYNLMILDGFDEFMHFVVNNKEECIRILEVFKGNKIRSLTKSTEKYASMIRYANHPSYNSEMKYRERLMMNIWAYPYLDKRIVSSEVNDLLFNDIPIFFTYTDSRDLIDSRGNVYKNFYGQSGYEASIKRIKSLDEKEIERQRCILLSSLGIIDSYMNQELTLSSIRYESRKFDYIKQAKNISEKLMREAYIKDDKCSFITLDCDDKKHWNLTPCDTSLYSGLSGIAVFFLEMFINTKEDTYYNYYQKIIRTAIDQTKNTVFESAFTGWLSPVYPLILEYRYLNQLTDSKYLEFTVGKLEKLTTEDIRKIKGSDYISGIAGIIRLLKLLQETFGNKYLSESIIDRFAEVLLERLEAEQVLNNVGIAHGISGIVLGLVSAKKIDSKLAKEMLVKEKQLEIPKKNIHKWCWGLSGMIQARIAIYNICPEYLERDQLDELLSEYESSLTAVISNDSLCHGNGSIVVTLKMIYEYTKEKKWLDLLELWVSNMYMNSLFAGYKIQKASDIVIKGLFDGMFGIAWLYLYVQFQVNNVLLLETK